MLLWGLPHELNCSWPGKEPGALCCQFTPSMSPAPPSKGMGPLAWEMSTCPQQWQPRGFCPPSGHLEVLFRTPPKRWKLPKLFQHSHLKLCRMWSISWSEVTWASRRLWRSAKNTPAASMGSPALPFHSSCRTLWKKIEKCKEAKVSKTEEWSFPPLKSNKHHRKH